MKMEKIWIKTDTMIKGLGFKDIKMLHILPCIIRRLLSKIANFYTCEFATMYLFSHPDDF